MSSFIKLGIALVALIIVYNILRPLFWVAIIALIIYCIYLGIPNYHVIKAQGAMADGDYKKAIRSYKKAIATKRAGANVKINYAYTLMRVGEFDRAESVLDDVIRLDNSKNEDIKNAAKQQLCMVYYKQGRMREALSSAYKMFNDGYKNSNLYAMLGYFKILCNEPIDDVTRFCEEAYEFNSDNRDIVDNLSICYYKQGRYKEAKELSDKILEKNPQFVEAYYHGAQIAIKCGDTKRAKELASKIDSCNRSDMTTISESEVNKLKREVGLL